MQYRIVSGKNAETVATKVELLIKEGWVLHGTLTVDNGKYVQALIKPEVSDGPANADWGE